MLETAESVQDMRQGELSGRQMNQLLHTYSSIHQHSLVAKAIMPYCGSRGHYHLNLFSKRTFLSSRH